MTRDAKRGEDRRSDAPVDLRSQRDMLVRTFLKEGVELTEELLRENTEMREELGTLRADNARLRAQVASDDAIRDLLRTIEALEVEKKRLTSHSATLEEQKKHHEGRFEEIEREVNDLANLYIASYQLHTSLSARRVVRHLKDILGQLVGAESFVIYVLDPTASEAFPVGWEGVADESVLGAVKIGEGPVGEACLTGLARVRERPGVASFSSPVAVIPMMADGRPVGAIAIASMLEQKGQWESVDRELFKLLGDHAGTALIAASLYSRAGGPVPALSGLSETLEHRASAQPEE